MSSDIAPDALAQLQSAEQNGQLSASAAKNIRSWLTEPRYAEYAGQVSAHLAEGKWQELDDAFWTVIPFGTGGRRGRMYPIGCNAINDRTIGESAQGLAEYVKQQHSGGDQPSCAIAYDTRHRSREFAELCGEVMVAAGLRVYMLDGYRATPELSFLIRYKQCSCGIMVTASHNPPSDNAVKAYWSTGGQLVPPHDNAVIENVQQVAEINRIAFSEAVAEGQVEFCTEEVDKAYVQAVIEQSFPKGPRDVKIIYSPLHGVGESAVSPVLADAGFADVEVFQPHREPSGDFPNVPGHVSNPENAAVFDAIIERARQTGADLTLATDPDCDRMGAAAPVTSDIQGEWRTLNGNQLAALLCDYVLQQHHDAGTLTEEHYVVKTLVTTDMMRRIADSYGVKTYGDLLVGFKWIGLQIDESGPDRFLFGAEESHGYLAGHYIRDKDGALACMLIAELAAKVKSNQMTLHQKLDELYQKYGLHAEHLLNVRMEGSDGMQRMKSLMSRLRCDPPAQLGGLDVAAQRDYLNQQVIRRSGEKSPLEGPAGDLVILDLDKPGNYVAVRPSGTEPKVKFYLFGHVPVDELNDMDESKQALTTWMEQCSADLEDLVQSV